MRYFIKRCLFEHDITIRSPKDGNAADITLKEIKVAYPKINALVNNAGIHSFEQRMALEGFAEMMAVNYLAPRVLSYTLHPKQGLTSEMRLCLNCLPSHRPGGEVWDRMILAPAVVVVKHCKGVGRAYLDAFVFIYKLKGKVSFSYR